MKQLRSYQTQAIDAAVEAWREHQSVLMVLATGTGKTVIASHIIGRMDRPTLFLAHREELIWQSKDKIEAITGFHVGVEMANYRTQYGQSIFGGYDAIVSTVQTQYSGNKGEGRMATFDPNQFGLLVVDECHHFRSARYAQVIDYYRQNPRLKVLGLTATPNRSDKKALGKIFEHCCFNYGIAEGVGDGWLVPIRQRMVTVESLDLSNVRSSCGDLNEADVEGVMRQNRVIEGVAIPVLELIGRRKTLVFGASVKHAEDLCNFFNARHDGIARWVCGKTDKDERRQILNDHAAGRFQILVNVDVLIEGYNDPSIEVIVIARPTKSTPRYMQMSGRGTRPLEGLVDAWDEPAQRIAAIAGSAKSHLELIDFAGNAGKHKLVTAVDVLGGDYDDAVVVKAKKAIEEAGQAIDPKAALEAAKAQIAAEKEEQDRRKREEMQRRANLAQKPKYVSMWVDPFGALDMAPPRESMWTQGRELSDKQRSMIEKHYGLDPDAMTYAEGKKLVDELFRRWKNNECSPKQANILKKHGLDIHASREQASEWIGMIKSGHAPAGAKETPAPEPVLIPGF